MSFILLGILNSQAAGAGGFPIPGVEPDLWLDASDASTITESGGSVSQWNNKGSGPDFIQATSADQPTTGASTQNGLNVIDFADDKLTHNGTLGDFNFLHNGTEYFYALVINYDNTDQNVLAYVGSNNGASANVGVSFYIDNRSGDNAFELQISNGSSGNNVVSLINDNGFFSSGFDVVSALLDPDNATAANRISYFKNNTEGLVTNSSSNSPSTADPAGKLTIGSQPNGNGSFPGSIGELIIVSGADATETNRAEVVSYLNSKWSIF